MVQQSYTDLRVLCQHTERDASWACPVVGLCSGDSEPPKDLSPQPARTPVAIRPVRVSLYIFAVQYICSPVHLWLYSTSLYSADALALYTHSFPATHRHQ